MSGFSAPNTKVLTASGEVLSGKDIISALEGAVVTAAAATATAKIYDGTDATGRQIGSISATAGETNSDCGAGYVESGHIYVAITGAGAEVTIGWK